MGLTDFSTLLIAILATLTVTLGTSLLWKRIFRKGFPNLFLRICILLLAQALALVAVGLAVNRANGFFETWSDVFGSGANYSSAAISSAQLPTLDEAQIGKGKKLSDGAVMISDVITGKSSAVSNIVHLYLPHSAVAQLSKKRALNSNQFKVVEFLTGFPSQPIMWFKVMQIEKELAGYNSTHRKAQIIGIFPQVNVAGNYDLECMNLPNGKPKAETWLAEDMHTYFAKRVGIVNSQWSIVGLSTGGWCSAMLTLKHPELFDKAVSIAGYYRSALPLSDPQSLQDWAKKNYALDKFEKLLPNKEKLYLVASLGDRYSIKETRKYLALKHPNLEIKYREIASGGHNPHVWVPSIKPALDWL